MTAYADTLAAWAKFPTVSSSHLENGVFLIRKGCFENRRMTN